MKKLLFFAIALIMASCKDKPKDEIAQEKATTVTGDETVDQTQCESCPNMNSSTVYTRLQNEGQIICDLCLYEGIADEHDITQNDYNNYTNWFWGTTGIVSKPISWGSLKGLTDGHCYDRHVMFEYDPATRDGNISHSLQPFNPTYVAGKSYYSIPFLRGIAMKHNLCQNSQIIFTKAKRLVNLSTRIVILVSVVDNTSTHSGTTFHYDITENPKRIDKSHNSPL